MIPFDQPILSNIQDAKEAYWFIICGFAYAAAAWMAYEAIAWTIRALWRGLCKNDEEAMWRSQERREKEGGE